MNAPIEPFDGFLREGLLVAGDEEGFFACAGEDVGAAALAKLISGSSAIIAMSKPAQPSWLSTTFGS